MSLLDDLKAKADLNGDGKISLDDLESLRDDKNGSVIDQLKDKADQNGDGKLDLEDFKNFNVDDIVNDAKKAFGDVKDKFFK